MSLLARAFRQSPDFWLAAVPELDHSEDLLYYTSYHNLPVPAFKNSLIHGSDSDEITWPTY